MKKMEKYIQIIVAKGNERPFKECLIHGLIRDKEGRKMAKSLGNGVDPMDVIEEYGCDSLRYFLATSTSNGQDLRYDEEKIKSTWNFINKLWNATRYSLMNISDLKEIKLSNLNTHDKWILTKYNMTIKEVIKYMDKYEFNNVGNILYSFIWDDFCDNYIEMSKFSKDEENTKSTLCYVITGILKLLHPFMPYVTEELYQSLPIKRYESIMISDYPKYNKEYIFKEEYDLTEKSIAFIKLFRNISGENGIPKTAPVMINNNNDYSLIIKVLRLEDRIINKKLDINSYDVNLFGYSMTIYFEKKEDLSLINKEIDSLKSSIERREKLLSNEGYLNKAPKNLIEKEKETLEIEKNKLNDLKKKYK